ncbi:nuclear transport factor 2 family protein [Thioalkalivibrio sp. AKL19]|uniref:nuclear transport factor 2 family protein n=1 Tax=Thioalkalivibrio sp. AKL19 TaxID=1266914 RepID=UPI0004629FC1|nr:nuclear transport factor 2 family protein [Thioalkalivibrio sp. AKL19]
MAHRGNALMPGDVDRCVEDYYAAFRAADIEQMMRLWGERPDIVCIHPGSPRAHRGVAEVMESWLLVFARELNIGIEPKIVGRHETGEIISVVIEEAITRPGDVAPTGTILISQTWRWLDDRWRLLFHHASHGRRSPPSQDGTFVPNGGGSTRH